jgi:hypothetical protein
VLVRRLDLEQHGRKSTFDVGMIGKGASVVNLGQAI